MSRFQFELATANDDQALRELLAATPMPGAVLVTLRREPSFFGAAAVDGRFRQVIIVRDRTTGRIIGLGSRSVRNVFMNGHARPVGYLSSLRIREPYRGTAVLARGYQFLRELHADGRAPLYLSTIAEGNRRAMRILTSRRAGLPSYHYLGKYYTLAIPLARSPRRATESDPAICVRSIRADNARELVAFLQSVGPRRQFFPEYTTDDFFTQQGTFRDLRPADVLVAYRRGEIVGTLAAWNQREFRQTVIEGYTGTLRLMRPLYNSWARLKERPRLPASGTALRSVMAAVPVVRNDNHEVFAALLRALIAGLAAKPHDCLLVGLHNTDPLFFIARRLSVHTYVTRLYLVCWDDGEAAWEALDSRPPYLELGTL